MSPERMSSAGGRGSGTRLGWAHDLALGVRLAVSGRGGPARVVLTALGVGLGVAVLLLTVSLVTADNERKLREDARIAVSEPTGEPARLLQRFAGTQFRDEYIRGEVLDAIGPNPPLPPGVGRVPEDGEVFVSPALADLLASPDGELLRPRIPWRIAGTIGKEGLVDPWDLLYYAGGSLSPEDRDVSPVYGYGGGRPRQSVPLINVLFGLAGGLLLLMPVFVLVGAATRIAAAARERRLAALRLVGAGANQTRRIASGEALVGAVAGLLIGGVVFAVGARVAERVRLLGFGVFAGDLRPPLLGVALIVVVVPALAVLSGVVALRHSIGSPLGVTRQAKPPRRRLWWRVAPLAVGVALLVPQAGAFTAGTVGLFAALSVLAGMLLVGISVPLLLPWLLQRAVDPLAGGPPSWQLAIRRMQLDSGTPARAAAGVAAILTGVVALQSMLAVPFANPPETTRGDTAEVSTTRASIDDPGLARLADVQGVREVVVYNVIFGNAGQGSGIQLVVAGCPTLRKLARIDDCADGDIFVTEQGVRPGVELAFRASDGEQPVEIGHWTVPPGASAVELRPDGLDPEYTVLVTPAARPAVAAGWFVTRAQLTIDPGHPDAIEHVRNAMVDVDPLAAAYTDDIGASGITEIRNGLLVGSLIVLLLAAASLLIVSIEQVRERRQQLAALAAAGVPARTLAASVLWQAMLPFGVAATFALAVGIGLAALMLRVFGFPFTVDWSTVGAIVGASGLAVLLVAALTMPSLRSAIRPESLRTE